jgi:hypothetical protein
VNEPIPFNHPNLVEAAIRLRRILQVWAVIFLGYGALSLAVLPPKDFMAAAPWLASAVLLAFSRQPALLALAAVLWGVSIIVFIPGVDRLLGADALAGLLGGGTVELVALILARVLLGVTAWNQFLFYRMLYGTARASGLDPSQPLIPEVIPNKTNRLAWASRLVGSLSLACILIGVPLSDDMQTTIILQTGYSLSVVATGFGLGAAFSPTDRRGAALMGVGLGLIAFIMTLTAGRYL